MIDDSIRKPKCHFVSAAGCDDKTVVSGKGKLDEVEASGAVFASVGTGLFRCINPELIDNGSDAWL